MSDTLPLLPVLIDWLTLNVYVSCYVVVDMKRMVQEMINEVEIYESEVPASEELYNKLELKVRKKFNDEIDRLEKSFRRIMEQLEI